MCPSVMFAPSQGGEGADELRSNHVALVTESSCDGTHRTEKEFPHTK